MSTHPDCDVQVGVHPAPFWVNRNNGVRVCDRHRGHFEERADEFGPFDWAAAPVSEDATWEQLGATWHESNQSWEWGGVGLGPWPTLRYIDTQALERDDGTWQLIGPGIREFFPSEDDAKRFVAELQSLSGVAVLPNEDET